jgi:cytoplasmic iron level regulating protein YaaA (DUF328/UPF0246 family)
MAYLITCAGSKKQPHINNASAIDALSFSDTLNDAREGLLLQLNMQVELNWNLTLPAWQLYSGNYSKIYPRIAQENWEKNCVDIRILSALFGWVKHTDLLPYYDLKMDDRIPGLNHRVWKYWFQQNLLNHNQFVNPQDIDLLSQVYRKAIHGNPNPIATLPNAQFTDYGVQKGNWLNIELSTLKCN